MSGKIELNALLDLALGQQAEGTVNFKILHGFLKNLLGHLAISNVEVEISDYDDDKPDKDKVLSTENESSREFTKPNNDKKEVLSQYGGAVERRVRGLEDRLQLLDSFAGSDDILKWAKGREDSKSKIADMWNFMNMQKRIEATENGVKKISSVVDKILSQLKNVTDLQERMYQMEKRMDELGDLKHQLNQLSEKLKCLDDTTKIDELLQQLNNLKNRIENMPLKDDLQIFVQWPQLQSALEFGRVDLQSSMEKTDDSATQQDTPSTSTSSKKVDSSRHPSKETVTTLGKLGKIIPAHHKLEEEVDKLKSMLDKKANIEDLENLASKQIPDDLVAQLGQLNGDVAELKLWKDDVDEDRIKLATMQTSLDDLETAVESLQKTMKHVVDEHGRKQKHIDTLYSLSDKLKESKMDKDDVISQLNSKADKADLDNFVSRQRFDTNITRIDDLLKELIDKFRTSDEALNKMIVKIISDLEGKIDRDELKELKDYLDSRLKALKAKQREEPVMDEDPAAVFKKAMQFNCLSCDRAVYFSPNGPMQGYSGMPMQKSTRPYTTYELDQLRMLQKGSLKPESNDYSTYRSCGGSHTSSNPNKRISAKLNTYISSYEEVPVPTPTVRSEVDIQGQDGKLYKGRLDKNEEFPDVNRRQMQNGRIKPKSAHAGMRSSSSPGTAEGPLVPRRPKTAFHRSPTPDQSDRSTPDRPERPTPERAERPQSARLRTPSPDLSNVPAGVEDQGMTEVIEIA